MKIITWNVRSIKSLNAFQRFKNDIAGFVSNEIDIIILSETWTNDSSTFDLYKLTNYQHFSCSRPNTNGGGVKIYVHNKHVAKLANHESLDSIEYLSIVITIKNLKVVFYAVYRPPLGCINSFFQKLEEILNTNKMLVIAGDFNINNLKLDRTSTEFADILKVSGASITNHAVTRNSSKTLIDYFIIKNFSSNVSAATFTSTPLLSSDHNLLLSLLNILAPKRITKTVVSKRCNYTQLKDRFQCDENLLLNLPAVECCNYVSNAIRNAMESSTSLKSIQLKNSDVHPKWADQKYYILSNKMANLLKKINSLESNNRPTSKLRHKLNVLKSTIDSHSNVISRNFYSNLISNNKNNSWHVINTILGRHKSTPTTTITVNDKIISDKKEIADIFNNKFSSTAKNPTFTLSTIIDSLNNVPKVEACMYFDVVTFEEVAFVIDDLDAKKATGSDGIPCRVIKELKNHLVSPLTLLINKIVMEGDYPDTLKYATIKPLHKKGDKSDISNYRPIALLPVINKIFERIICNRIQYFLDSNKINDKEQYGYKRNIGTNDAILRFSHEITEFLDEGNAVIVIFMDLTAAFDTLNRDVLLEKLSHLGIRGHVHTLLSSYFSNRSQAVKIDDTISSILIIDEGVAQGSILSPILFNVNLYDSPPISSQRIKFADDNVIYKKCKKSEIDVTMDEMLADVHTMAKHFENSGLKLNYSKTNFMVIGANGNSTVPMSFPITESINIQRVTSSKFLGVTVDEDFNFKEHHSNLMEKLTQSCRALSIIRHHLPRELLLQFFNGHIMSHLYFCPFIFAKFTQEEITRLQRIQNRCIKLIFGLDVCHSTIDLFKTYVGNTLPVIGIIYFSLITNIHKSMIMNKDELIKFNVSNSNRRSSGDLIASRFRKKQQLGTDITYLGVILYNQLPKELKEIKILHKFKLEVKKYLIGKIDLLFAADQFHNRRIS